MPLFFMISGTLSNKLADRKLGGYVKKKCRTLLLPYFSFSIVGSFFNGMDVFPSYFLSSIKGGLWFLPCLFVCSVMLILVCKASQRLTCIRKVYSDFLGLTVATLLLGVLYLVIPDSLQDVFIPGTLLLYWPYFALGYMISHYDYSLSDQILVILGVIFILVWWSDCYYHVYFKPLYQLSRLCAVLFFYYLFKNRCYVGQVMSNIGRESLCIYLMHYFFIKGICSFILSKCGYISFLEISVIVMISVIISYICIIIKRILVNNRYLGFLLFGQSLQMVSKE